MTRTDLAKIVENSVGQGIQSVILFPGMPALGDKGRIVKIGEKPLTDDDVESLFLEMATSWQRVRFEEEKAIEYTHEIEGLGRYRVSAFKKLGGMGVVVRPLPDAIPSFESLGLPGFLQKIAEEKQGLVLITGSAKSGKSTSLAALIDVINRTRRCHIVIIEDVIEYVHTPDCSIISQREIGRDTRSIGDALRRVLREDPDVVSIGDIQDSETMAGALEFAEAGHLVFATLHTVNAVQTLNRVIDFFPEGHKQQVRAQLAANMRAIISQRLISRVDGPGFVCAFEVLTIDQSAASLIRQNKFQQITSLMTSLGSKANVSMDSALSDLYAKGSISLSSLIGNSSRDERFLRKIAAKAPAKDVVLTGETFLEREGAAVVYRADFGERNISQFDSSGNLFNTPRGLLFRQGGRAEGSAQFIADYSPLGSPGGYFTLKSIFHVAYEIRPSGGPERSCTFQLRAVTVAREEVLIPLRPVELIADDAWHTLVLPVPGHLRGRKIRYYMLLLGGDVREILFNNLYFG